MLTELYARAAFILTQRVVVEANYIINIPLTHINISLIPYLQKDDQWINVDSNQFSPHRSPPSVDLDLPAQGKQYYEIVKNRATYVLNHPLVKGAKQILGISLNTLNLESIPHLLNDSQPQPPVIGQHRDQVHHCLVNNSMFKPLPKFTPSNPSAQSSPEDTNEHYGPSTVNH